VTLHNSGDLGEQSDARDLGVDPGTPSLDRRTFLTRAAALSLSATAATALTPRAAQAAPVARARHDAPSVTLNYWRHFFEPEVNLERKIAKQYMASHPNIQVAVVDQGATDAENQKVLVAFAGGGAPDIIFVYNGYFPQYVALGALDGWKYNGQYYGVPGNASSYVMVISPPLFRAAGLDPVKDAPKTWEDIARIGPELTRVKNGAIVQQGLGLSSYAIVMALVFDAMLHQLGGSVISADGKTATINSPAAVEALQTLDDFVNKYKISQLAGKPLQGPGFNTGNTAIICDVGLWYRGFLQQSAPKIYANGEGLKFLPFPRYASGKDLGGTPYGYAWCVNARSPQAEEAWKFIRYMSAREILPDVGFGDIPPRASLVTNKQLMANPDTALALQELSTGAHYAAIPDQVATIIYAAVTSALLDHVPPKTALAQANQQLNALIPTLPYKLSL
jgi:multiple sugar transport system substrate-binding protein